MENNKFNKLTEYKLRYDEANNTRQYLGNKMTQIITIYTASASCTMWNLMKCINKFSEYKKCLQKNFAIIFLILSFLFLLYELILYLQINHIYKREYVRPLEVKKLFDDASSEEILQNYSQQQIDTDVYNDLCDAYIDSAIKNEKMNNKITPKQKRLLESILVSFFVIAMTFCIVTIVF